MRRLIVLAFAMIWMTVLPEGAAAHGTDYRVIEETPVIAAEFFYSDKKPMRYAEVLVFSPENDVVEYQNGRTDQNGRFAFYPEMPGNWLVKVNDGMGHAVRAEISVKPAETAGGTAEVPAEPKRQPTADASMIMKALLGLSLLLNLFLGMYAWKSNH
ncbi:MAG: hypothetical protein U5L07_16960 [Desulfobacterales bacterium]|nr:hypothetical protein [Desulfobacterales bacterium]